MTTKRTLPGALFPSTFETISSANSTAIGLNTTARLCDVLHISVETADARYRADGTDPALTTGVLLQKDADYWFYGHERGTGLKFIRSTGTCKISVMGYTYEDA